jgi:branched-chain amino acid transport system substrate-binding protein
VIAQGITKAKTTDGAALAKALEGTEFNLLSGKLVWTDAAQGHFPDKEAFIVQVKSGKPTFVQRLKPDWTPDIGG